MFRIHTAVMTAALTLAVSALASAQSSSDTVRTSRQAIRHDQRILAVDSTKLKPDLALRDSARATLAQDQAQTRTLAATRSELSWIAIGKPRRATRWPWRVMRRRSMPRARRTTAISGATGTRSSIWPPSSSGSTR